MYKADYLVRMYVALLEKFDREGLPADGNWSRVHVTLIRNRNNTRWPQTVIQYKGKALSPNRPEEMMAAIKTVIKRLPSTRIVVYENDTLWDVMNRYPTKSYDTCVKAMQAAGLAV